MDFGLRDKIVLITGGSKGIGLACARVFRAEGARVALVSRSRANLDAASKLLGDACDVVAADLVAFAASERGRYLSGANITLDGAASPSVV